MAEHGSHKPTDAPPPTFRKVAYFSNSENAKKNAVRFTKLGFAAWTPIKRHRQAA